VTNFVVGSWHEFWVGIIDYILPWDTGRLRIWDDESFDGDRTSEITSSVCLL